MKILIIQPYLTKYRADLFNEISEKYKEVNVISSKDKNYEYGLGSSNKFNHILLKRINFFFFISKLGSRKKFYF